MKGTDISAMPWLTCFLSVWLSFLLPFFIVSFFDYLFSCILNAKWVPYQLIYCSLFDFWVLSWALTSENCAAHGRSDPAISVLRRNRCRPSGGSRAERAPRHIHHFIDREQGFTTCTPPIGLILFCWIHSFSFWFSLMIKTSPCKMAAHNWESTASFVTRKRSVFWRSFSYVVIPRRKYDLFLIVPHLFPIRKACLYAVPNFILEWVQYVKVMVEKVSSQK